MITINEIRAKADLLYPRAIRAWLENDDQFFPYRLKASLARDRDTNIARQAQHSIIAHSNADGKPSYSLRFRESNSRLHAKQNFISAICFDSLSDLIGFVGKEDEFSRLQECVNQLDRAFPDLQSWRARDWRKLLKCRDELPELIEFTQYIVAHPMPGCHIRELPIAISTKTIDRCESLVSQWLEILLPPLCKNSNSATFAERFGFEELKDHFRIRILDEELLPILGLQCDELSLPISALSALDVRDCHIILVENKVNLTKLPTMRGALALGGLGYGITRLFELPWLNTNRLSYWGDLDVDGFDILSHVRRRFPHVMSVLMDSITLSQFMSLTIRDNPRSASRPAPTDLTEDELATFQFCSDRNLRLEQERVSREFVAKQLCWFERQSDVQTRPPPLA